MHRRWATRALVPTADRPLIAEGRRYPVASGALTPHLATERWDPVTRSHRYGIDHLCLHLDLELAVDDRSGDGGEVAPDLRVEVTQLPCPTPGQLAGQQLDRLGTATGRLGPGAPALDQIEVEVQALLDPATAVVRAEARYRWQPDRPSRQLAFAGPVALRPLTLRVREADHAGPFLDQAFGPAWRDAMTLADDGAFELPTTASPDRRRWLRYRCLPR